MRRRQTAIGLAAATTVALSVSLLGVPASADESSAPTNWDKNVVRPEGKPVTDAPPAQADGVIVKTRGDVSTSGIRSALAQAADMPVQPGAALAPMTKAFETDSLISLDEAEQLARDLESRPDVEWAEPNLMLRHTAAWPSPVNDTYAGKLRNVWDTRNATDSSVATWRLNAWPAGGYGTKAPAIWKASTGRGTIVAVIDTGVRPNHPDLRPKLVPGYDMISKRRTSNDGNGRDRNPADPGDWNRAGFCGSGSPPSDSSWHGTHVAGTIGAVTNNRQGVAGVAPGVRLQTVRVLGRCGGSLVDVGAGIRWAAGVKVPGAPRNRRPAKVLNLSLGGFGQCSRSMQSSINAARRRGATVVVALGNETMDARNFTPANCNGVVGVHSTSGYGDAAGYSNYGSPADVSAPGGDYFKGQNVEEMILSTYDTGTRGPGQPALGWLHGTSMAAPAVSGVAALLRSASENRYRPASLERALRAAVAPFPTSGRSDFNTCNTSRCGTGIIDVSKVPAAVARPVINGRPQMGQTLSVGNVAWVGPGIPRVATWRSNGRIIARGMTMVAPRRRAWQRITVRIHPKSGPFRLIGKTSKRVIVPGTGKQTSSVAIRGKRKVAARKRIRYAVRVRALGIRPRGVVRVFVNGKRVQVKRLLGKHRGRVAIRAKFRKGRNKLRVVYSGNKRIKSSQRTSIVRGR